MGCDVDGVLFNKDKTELIAYPSAFDGGRRKKSAQAINHNDKHTSCKKMQNCSVILFSFPLLCLVICNKLFSKRNKQQNL